jgi:hypothetical protein
MPFLNRQATAFANFLFDKQTHYKEWLNAKIIYKKGYRSGLKEKKKLNDGIHTT